MREIISGERKIIPIPPKPEEGPRTAYETGIFSLEKKRMNALNYLYENETPSKYDYAVAMDEMELCSLRMKQLQRRKELNLIE